MVYRSETGSKDAVETLNQLTADCGGQARALAALSRAAGIPSRVVGGLLLEPGVKQITHVWVENYINGQWIPFDTVNDHFAEIPKHYLVLYNGDVPLLRHAGVDKVDYYFNISYETMPPVDQPWSLFVIPVHFHNLIKTALIIPIGAMLVAASRLIIGIEDSMPRRVSRWARLNSGQLNDLACNIASVRLFFSERTVQTSLRRRRRLRC